MDFIYNFMFGLFLGVLPIVPFYWLILLVGSITYIFIRRIWAAGLCGWLLGFLLFPIFMNDRGSLISFNDFGTRLGFTIAAALSMMLLLLIARWIGAKFKAR